MIRKMQAQMAEMADYAHIRMEGMQSHHTEIKVMVQEVLNQRSPHSSPQARGGARSMLSSVASFTTGQDSTADVASLAEEVVIRSVAQGFRFDANPSLVMGTIAVIHEAQPRFVAVRAKYDTGAEANFIPAAFVEKYGLSSLLEAIPEDDPDGNVFIGLNNEEYTVQRTITLSWSASAMHRVPTTIFYVADDLPYDILLGDPFIQKNNVFDIRRIALPLRRKRRDPSRWTT
jgi:hypothetical protein